MSLPRSEPDHEDFARRHLTRNVLALGGDFAFYSVGLAFASQATILPAFAASLGAPNIVIGAIPAVTTLGWLLPPLFVAGHTETLGRKLPFVMRYTIWERVPYLGLALTAFFVAEIDGLQVEKAERMRRPVEDSGTLHHAIDALVRARRP